MLCNGASPGQAAGRSRIPVLGSIYTALRLNHCTVGHAAFPKPAARNDGGSGAIFPTGRFSVLNRIETAPPVHVTVAVCAVFTCKEREYILPSEPISALRLPCC